MNNIIFIGFATSGKTSIGKKLALQRGMSFVDTDAQTETKAGKSIQTIFQQDGEEYFRKLENDTLSSLVTVQNTVISCGGGSVLCSAFPALATKGRVVWLKVSSATVLSRLYEGRPLFDSLEEIRLREYMSRREELYSRYASLVFNTDGLTVSEAAYRLNALL